MIYDSAIGDTYIWKGKDVCGDGSNGTRDGMLRGMERLISRSETHFEMFLECYPAGLEQAGASGELIVDWLWAHHFALMAIDEKARRFVPADSIDLRTPSF